MFFTSCHFKGVSTSITLLFLLAIKSFVALVFVAGPLDEATTRVAQELPQEHREIDRIL